MLQKITVDGFRCFDTSTSIELGALTLLAGNNSAGKSSIIHALAALMQSEQQQSGNHLALNGEWADLGSFNQLVNYGRSRDQRQFSLGLAGTNRDNELDVMWTLGEPEDPTAEVAQIKSMEAWLDGQELTTAPGKRPATYFMSRRTDETQTLLGKAHSFRHPGEIGGVDLLPCTSSEVLYLGASRLAPQRLYQIRRTTLGPLLGRMGEYAAETILKRGRTMVDVLPDAATGEAERPLFAAFNAWWSYIFDRPHSLRVEVNRGLGFTLAVDTPSAENLELGQVGLGLSQILPILTLGLCSRPGDIVVVESPEAHLHPAAQHRLCDFFIQLARTGRQVVLETHSDHIVNAARLAAKRGTNEPGLAPETIAVHFFTQAGAVTSVERLLLDDLGRFNRWPDGFFDQASQALLELLR